MAISSRPSSLHPPFTDDHKEVTQSEKIYLAQRRAMYGETHRDDRPGSLVDLWGIAFSGGGIRSATLSLGILQQLIKTNWFKKFDYMSSVSGGGYMAACFSSLMNNEADTFFIPKRYRAPSEKHKIPGLSYDTSPFVYLIETKIADASPPKEVPDPGMQNQRARSLPSLQPDQVKAERRSRKEEIVLDYKTPEETKLDVRHQIHHLRTHGEYLTPDKGLLSVDVQKALGTVLAGIIHNFFLFALFLTAVVALHFLFLGWLSADDPSGTFFDQISQQAAEGKSFWQDGYVRLLSNMIGSLGKYPYHLLGLGGLGLLVSVGFIWLSRSSVRKFLRWDKLENVLELEGKISAGHDREDYFERRFLRRFGVANIAGGLFVAVALWVFEHNSGRFSGADFWLFFGLPAVYSLGIFLGTYFILAFVSQRPKQIRYSRSLHGDLRGSAFYGLVVSFLVPLGLLFLFSVSLYWKGTVSAAESNSGTLISTISSIASVIAGYFTLNQKEGDSSSVVSRILNKVKGPLMSILVLSFVGLAAYSIIRITSNNAINQLPLWTLGISTLLFIISGFYVNSNKLSLHYFYRDRLSEAYLRTDGRVRRKDNSRQGMPLINLRNDEDLVLQDLGWQKLKGEELDKARRGAEKKILQPTFRYDEDGSIWKPNPKVPYHLIVTALNLQGTNELVRKDLKSDHFIFSRDYIGSQSTGYVRTDLYRQGRTKLARAMTISAAAVSSGMGFSSFFAQSFITTLLNLRLGYWVENPWFYRNNCNQQWVDSRWQRLRLKLRGWEEVTEPSSNKEGQYCMQYVPQRKFTFWPYYLLQEMMGLTTANERLVNVSDGGHTGDNLGLLPLLRRRCKLIVVCDFEEDKKFGFGSFNHLVRMANIEENIEIDIDLQVLEPRKTGPDALKHSQQSVALGQIHYPDNQEGLLLYVKSSINTGSLPVNVYNYRKQHPDFPHESTADQYFDDAQFEAYRALGFHIGEELAEILQDQGQLR